MNDHTSLERLRRIDLNLLTVLHAVLETGSTKGAADRLGRTQSAASHALGRLRDLFEDPLFIRHGPKLIPTPLALSLQHPLGNLLHEAVSLVESGSRFDPRTSDRCVTVAAPDISFDHAFRVCRQLSAAAPNLDLRIENHRHGVSRLLKGEVDVLFRMYQTEFPAGLHVHRLKNAEWATLVRTEHPISDTPRLEEWANFEHVQVYTGGQEGRSPINDALALAGLERRLSLRVHTFLAALHAVAGSDLMFTTMADLVASQAEGLGLRRVRLPLDVPAVPHRMVLRDRPHDTFGQWLRAQLADVA